MTTLNQVYYSGTLSDDFADLAADKVCFIYPDVDLNITSLTTVSGSLLSIYGANVTLMKGSTFTTTQGNSGISDYLNALVDVSDLPNENIYVWYVGSSDFDSLDNKYQTAVTGGVDGANAAEKQQNYDTQTNVLTQNARKDSAVNNLITLSNLVFADVLTSFFGSDSVIAPATDANFKHRRNLMKRMLTNVMRRMSGARTNLKVQNNFARRRQTTFHRSTKTQNTTIIDKSETEIIDTTSIVGEDSNFVVDLDEVNDIVNFNPLGTIDQDIYVKVKRVADTEGEIVKEQFELSTGSNLIVISSINENDALSLLDTSGTNTVTVSEDTFCKVQLTSSSRFLIIDFGSVDGEEGNSSGSGTSGGDPYCEPIFGNPIKLPNISANYRMFESNGLYINASVSPSTSEDKYRILEYLKNNKYSQDVIDTAIYDGYFYDKFYISYKGESLLLDLNSETEPEVNNDVFTVKKQLLTNGLQLVNNDTYGTQTVYECRHEDHGKVEILVQKYYNPQIKNGISIILERNAKQATGLLVYNYKPKFMTLPNIKIQEYKTLQRKLQKAVLKCKNIYKTQHTVIESNEVWVNKNLTV